MTGGTKGLGDYTIPMANTFAADGDPKTLGEIYAYGFRNAHRLSWDTDGTMFASDIGMDNVEEVNIVRNGENYGWMRREGLWEASVLIVVAGMEGALPSVVAGLVSRPVIAVPTSVGYGASFGGLAALLGMLNSCGSGVTVVNIDNGFGAGYAASYNILFSNNTYYLKDLAGAYFQVDGGTIKTKELWQAAGQDVTGVFHQY